MRFSAEVAACVDALLQADGVGAAVAFDADGTLWRGDIGEDLLRYMAVEDVLPEHRGRRGVYDEYERRVGRDPADAYGYAVEVMAGMREDELSSLCERFFARRFEGRLFPYVRPLFSALTERGYAVWIVSASPLWPVRAAAKSLGVPADQVIGVECDVEGGTLTRRVHLPVPCGEGKVHWLKARGVRPVLAFGNGDLDEPMLAYAQQAVVVAPPTGENGLTHAARGRGWPVHRC